jgi:hypothetical protein
MKKGDQEWESGVESIERDLYYNIDMSFTHLKNNFPSLESVYGKKIMDNWYDFIKWTCAQEYPEDIDFKKELDIEISPLIEFIHDQSVSWYYKYNADLIQDAKVAFSEECESCKGEGYIDEEQCEDCWGAGYDEDDESHWKAIDEARNNIIKSCNTSCFKELSKIKL